MATQRRIRRLVVGALFLCLTICTLVVKQYIFALLLGSVTYWLILSGIFEAFSDEPDPETGRPAMSKAWVLAGLAFFIAIAGLFAWLSPTRGQTHKTAEDIQLKVDRSGDPDAGLHQQYVSELVTPDDEAKTKTDELQQPVDRSREYVLNTNTNVFHLPECSYVGSILDENKEVYTGTRDSVADMGYEPCGHCNP
nr:MAG TPA: Metal binding domain of Ada [Caudoviricetes sp.]